jgi:hypothetical protein
MAAGAGLSPLPERAPRSRPGGDGGSDFGQARRGGHGRRPGYHIVAADAPLRADKLNENWWVLVMARGRPAAFLAPAAAREAVSSRPVIDYLRRRRAGYIADLTNYDDVFNRYLAPSDAQEPVIVFDRVAIVFLELQLEDSFELTDSYCERGYDPKPGTWCPGCTCAIRRIGR